MADAKRKKTSRLPEGRGIRKIEMPQTKEDPPAVPDTVPVGQLHIEVSEADRVLLQDIRERLEAQYGAPVSNSQVIRWAIWHCCWDDSSRKIG